MKKTVCFILVLICCFPYFALADDDIFTPEWRCDKCGGLTDNLYTVCSHCGKAMEHHMLYLLIDFKDNYFFSKYGVKIRIDNKPLFKLKHGEDAYTKVRLTEGEHTITFEKEDDDLSSSDAITLTEDGIYRCRIETKASGIIISNVEKKSLDISYEVGFSCKDGKRTRLYLSFDMDTNTYKYSSYTKHKQDFTKTGSFGGSFDDCIILTSEDGHVTEYVYGDRGYLYPKGSEKPGILDTSHFRRTR